MKVSKEWKERQEEVDFCHMVNHVDGYYCSNRNHSSNHIRGYYPFSRLYSS